VVLALAGTLDETDTRALTRALEHALAGAPDDEAATWDSPSLSESLNVPATPFAARSARRFAGEVCEQWQLPDLAEVAVQIVSELVTHALRVAQTDVELRIERAGDHLFLSVRDTATDDPCGWEAATDGWGSTYDEGYGLPIVQALARETGVHRHAGGGEIVWAALPTTTFDPATRAVPTPTLSVPAQVDDARTSGPHARWTVSLTLSPSPRDPLVLVLALTSQPAHPALPSGSWEAPIAVLREALDRPVDSPGVHAHPGPGSVVLELSGGRQPTSAEISAWRLQHFLDALP
jgi:hypothetical protein